MKTSIWVVLQKALKCYFWNIKNVCLQIGLETEGTSFIERIDTISLSAYATIINVEFKVAHMQ